MNAKLNTVLDDATIRRMAPSVFATEPYQTVSSKYRFLPTIEVVNAFRDSGYNVVSATQSRSRIIGKGDFTKHMLRLRHKDYMQVANVGDEVPELVLVNSHDRSSIYNLMLGIYRLACSNGMMVASGKIDSLSVRHSGSKDLLQEVIDVSAEVIKEAPKALRQINRFKNIPLSPAEQLAFATGARELMGSNIDVEPIKLLGFRRYADKPATDGTATLWQTTNVVQENLIRGGVRRPADVDG